MVSIATIPRNHLNLNYSNNTQLTRSRKMLKKAHIFGVIAAAFAIAPGAALADQVVGSDSVVNQGSTTTGINNVTGQSGNASTYQGQFKNNGWWGGAGNQTAGSRSGVNQGSNTYGAGNVTGQNGSSGTSQYQNSGSGYYGY
jgi:hypothetical protein